MDPGGPGSSAFAPTKAVDPKVPAQAGSKFLPDGQITQMLSRPSKEYIPVAASGKSALPVRPVLSRQEGRFAIVTNAGGDAVDVFGVGAKGCRRASLS
jgi:hypothetical protein